MDNLTSIQIILSAAFILFGSSVFYISSLISGNNVYLDLPTDVSTRITIIVGFLLFCFNPIAYIILTPALFEVDATKADQLVSMVLDVALLPFILSSVGFGIIFGCLSIISPRTTAMSWLRIKTSLSIPITTYSFSWDQYLRSLKPKALVELKVGKETLKGFIKYYSVKTEPKQLALETFAIENDSQIRPLTDADFYFDTTKKVATLFTELAQITSITAATSQFKKHGHNMYHQTQAFYWALAAIGCLLLFWGTDMVGSLMRERKFYSMLCLYNVAAFVFIVLALCQMLYSVLLSKIDYASYCSSFTLCPFTIKMFLLQLITLLMSFDHWLYEFEHVILIKHVLLFDYFFLQRAYSDFALFLSVIAIALFSYINHRNRELRKFFIRLETVIPQDKLRRLARYLVSIADLNAHENNNDELEKSVSRISSEYYEYKDYFKQLKDEIDKHISKDRRFLFTSDYLKEEEFNIIAALNSYLSKSS